MRTLAALAVCAGLVAVSAGAAEACSIRGRWCGYDTWAANAFEDWSGRVGVYGNFPGKPPPAPKTYVKRRAK